MGLCCLRVLRGLRGFCTRVWLGGLKTFCVFAFLFILFVPMFPLLCLSFYLFTASCPFVLRWSGCLSSPLVCPLVFLWVFVFSFSLADYTQKRKGAPFWCVLSCPVVGLLAVLKHYRYLLRFIVPISNPFTGNSCNLFRVIRWVVYYLPVFVNG